jgi:hypothetical protein
MRSIAFLARMTRSAMLDAAPTSSARPARSLGEWIVTTRHAPATRSSP